MEIKQYRYIDLIELKKYRLSYLNTFYLVIAGGIMHNYLDDTINYAGRFNIFPQFGQIDSIRWTLDDFINLWTEGIIHEIQILSIIIGSILVFSFILIFILFLKKASRLTSILIIAHMLLFLVLFYILGKSITFHSDAGAIIFISIYWGLPLSLCVLSTQDFKYMKNYKINRKDIQKPRKKIGIICIKLVFLSIGLFFLSFSFLCIIFQSVLLNFILSFDIISQGTINNVNFYIIGGFFLFLGCFSLLVLFKIQSKSENNLPTLLVSLLSFFFIIFGIIIFLVTLFLDKEITNILLSNIEETPEFLTSEFLSNIFIIVECLLLTLSILNLIMLIGLILRNNKIWRLTIVFYLFLSWTIIGLMISCYLSKDSLNYHSLKEMDS